MRLILTQSPPDCQPTFAARFPGRRRGKLYRTEVHRQPWLLQRAGVEVRANSLADPLGVALPLQPDLCHFCRCNKLLTWAPERLRLKR